MDKKYNAHEAEKRLLSEWDKNHIYEIKKGKAPLFSIDTPPPTVSGALHIGHIFSYTQTDIIARYQRLNGYSVFYPFGFDDNGLPTEKYVEKKLKVRAHELGRSKFIELCLEQTKESEEEFKNLWQRMGLSVDWNYWYSTISKEVRRISQLSFIKLFKKNYVYRQDEPALYCTLCRTTVAQAELDDKPVPSFFNDIVFKDQDGNELIIGTTRPELLYSCGALLYHPDDERYAHLKNKKAIVPLVNAEVPILEDEDVDIELGTGLVMVCTFGDQTDIQWWKKHKLPLKITIGPDGKFIDQAELIAGLKIKDARKKILEVLKEKNLLKNQKDITHSVNVHERCGTEIEYAIRTQWFIKILQYKDEFIKLADQVNWYPAFMKSRYIDWVQNIKWDWCISRQRFYGIPFPVWHCTSCNKILLPEEKDLPIDPQETNYPGSCPCGNANLIPDTDVMDTWNTSSLTPYICSNLFEPNTDPFEKNFLPMSMRPQAHDIIRTWAFYTIIKSWMHNKNIPWKEIVISGHVLSDKKEKLSKSKANNPLAPENLLQRYSADAIRYWTASGSLGHDISFSEAQLKVGQRLVTKLWNAFIFAQPHLHDFKPKAQPKEFGLVNEWILTSITDTFNTYQTYFEKHEFGLALQHVDHFFWHNFCDNYLELIKNQLFNPDEYSAEELYATKWTLYHVGLRILQLYSTYMPFVTDAIYTNMFKSTIGINSIHLTTFESTQQPFSFDQAKQLMKTVLHIISEVRRLKSDHKLSLKTSVKNLSIHTPDETTRNELKEIEQIIKGVTQAAAITYLDKKAETSLIKENETIIIVINSNL